HHFAAATQADLLSIVAPLQHLRSIRGDEDAYRFDLLVTRLQVELLKGGPSAPKVQDLRARVEEAVELRARMQNRVKSKADSLKQVRSKDLWTSVQVHHLGRIRHELRGIMKHQQHPPKTRIAPPFFDVTDADIAGETYIPGL